MFPNDLRGASMPKKNIDYKTLEQAVRYSDLKAIKQLVGNDINAVDDVGWTALHWAVKNNKEELCEQLIQKEGAEVCAGKNNTSTPLHVAAFFGHVNLIELLLNNGVPIDILDGKLLTPLYVAANEKRITACHLLLECGATSEIKGGPNARALIEGFGYTRLKEMAQQSPQERKNYAIYEAAHEGDIDKCSLLLNCGADVCAEDGGGATLLHLAAEKGNIALGQLLFNHKAKIDAEDNHKMTPLGVAISCGHMDFCESLLNCGIDVNIKNTEGMTLLHLAAEQKKADICQMLLGYGAKVNALNNEGQTPLAVAKRTWLANQDNSFLKGLDADCLKLLEETAVKQQEIISLLQGAESKLVITGSKPSEVGLFATEEKLLTFNAMTSSPSI
jgi:ankyrin repeat protein